VQQDSWDRSGESAAETLKVPGRHRGNAPRDAAKTIVAGANLEQYWSMARILLIACVLAAAGATTAKAQDAGPQTRMILGAGLGIAGGDAETRPVPGIAGHAGLAHQRGPLVFSFRLASTRGASTMRPVPGGGTLHDRYDELGVLAGYAIRRRPGSQAVLAAGVAAVAGERVTEGGFANRRFSTRVGIPIQLDISNPYGARSLGFALHANFNAEEPFGTMTVLYIIGRPER
jgi:hypothetical protein